MDPCNNRLAVEIHVHEGNLTGFNYVEVELQNFNRSQEWQRRKKKMY